MIERRERLIRELQKLSKSAQAELAGNTYYMAAVKIRELSEISGGLGPDQTGDVAPSFSDAIGEVRRLAEAELTDSRFYVFAHKLDELAFVARRRAGSSVRAEPLKETPAAASSHPVENPSEPSPQAQSFDELSAASYARVQAVVGELHDSAIIGTGVAARNGLNAESLAHEHLVDGTSQRLDRPVETLATSGISAESGPKKRYSGYEAHSGSAPASSGSGGGSGNSVAEATRPHAEVAVSSSPSENDPAQAAVGQALASSEATLAPANAARTDRNEPAAEKHGQKMPASMASRFFGWLGGVRS